MRNAYLTNEPTRFDATPRRNPDLDDANGSGKNPTNHFAHHRRFSRVRIPSVRRGSIASIDPPPRRSRDIRHSII
jgi:hypothetical protein